MYVKDNVSAIFYLIPIESSGNFLLSQAVARQVPSTLRSLTSVFGMGTGGSSLLSSPDSLFPLSLLLALSFLLDVAIHLRKLTLTLWSSPRTISTA